ncbi:MAG: hypothetical protein ACD_39C00122G0002 [uncultured bacterium]|nr:MAG: hypothetical protein ACD_39C00122G0002 [uncultured bacterium]
MNEACCMTLKRLVSINSWKKQNWPFFMECHAVEHFIDKEQNDILNFFE